MTERFQGATRIGVSLNQVGIPAIATTEASAALRTATTHDPGGAALDDEADRTRAAARGITGNGRAPFEDDGLPRR